MASELSSFGKTAQKANKLKVVELVVKRVGLLGAFPDLPLPAFTPPEGLPERIKFLDDIEGSL